MSEQILKFLETSLTLAAKAPEVLISELVMYLSIYNVLKIVTIVIIGKYLHGVCNYFAKMLSDHHDDLKEELNKTSIEYDRVKSQLDSIKDSSKIDDPVYVALNREFFKLHDRYLKRRDASINARQILFLPRAIKVIIVLGCLWLSFSSLHETLKIVTAPNIYLIEKGSELIGKATGHTENK